MKVLLNGEEVDAEVLKGFTGVIHMEIVEGVYRIDSLEGEASTERSEKSAPVKTGQAARP